MSSCSCVYVDTRDVGEFSTTTWRKARKKHRCCECGKEIKRGERYERVFGVWDGKCDVFITCTTCVEIRDNFFCNGYAFGMMFYDLREHLMWISELPCECLAQMSTAARAVVCDMIDDIWDDD